MNRFRLTILTVLFFQTGFAQKPVIIFDHYGVSEGFNSREALDITIAKNGLVWISSNDGLVRYDSKRFKFYRHIPGDSNSISNNYCKSLTTDNRDWVWVCNNDDLDILNPATENFTHVFLSSAKKEIVAVRPNALYYDTAADMMWVATKQGLYYSKKGGTTLQNVSTLTKDTTLAAASITSITAAGNNELWLTAQFEIYKLNTQNGDVEKTPIPFNIDGIVNDKNLAAVNCIYFDKNKTLWMGTWLKGMIEYNSTTKIFHQYEYSDYTNEENTITKILQTNLPRQENTLCVSTYGLGFSTFNIDSKKFTTYSTQTLQDKYGIKGNAYGMYLDPGSKLWIGSEFGLHQYNFSKQLFQNIDLSSITNGSHVAVVDEMGVEKSSSGKDEKLWFFIAYKGGYIYNLLQNKIEALPAKVAKYLNPPTDVFGFYIDSKNIIWISTKQYGLMGYDISKDEMVTVEKQYYFQTWQWINTFFEDKEKQLWLGSYKGLYLMDSSRKKLQPANAVNDILQQNNLSEAIAGITQDAKGIIWFTADHSKKRNACIGKYNPATQSASIVYNEASYPLVKNLRTELRDIYAGADGKIFAIDFGTGLLCFNETDSIPHFMCLNTDQGLSANYIEEFIPDQMGNIWCSSNFGLSYYKKNNQVFVNYSYDSYSMGSNNLPAIYLSPNSGIMYLGEYNGITYFDTHQINHSKNTSPLIFTEFKIFNEVFHPQNAILKSGDTWKLNHNENTISIEFALLSYSNSEDNRYSWKLEGYDKNWISGRQNVAAYANIKPGTYKLLVKAANSSGEWCDPVELTIVIKAPFYQTWWFILLCLISAAGVIYYLVQLRITRLKEKYELRNKIATDLHDEIGSTITSINILSNVSQQAMDKEPGQAKEMMEQIAAQSKQIQQNMSDIVWSIRPDNEKMEDLLVRMKEYTAQTLEPLQIKTNFNFNSTFTDISLALQYRKEVLLIFKEAINNISKHANATEVNINIHQTKNTLNLSIADNGQWKANGNSTGTGTRSMQQRAAVIGGTLTIEKTESGTSVQLNVAFT